MDKYKEYKDTGFEIIGEIPKHWEITSFKRVSSICTGSKNTEDELAGGKYDFFVRSDRIRKINSYSFDGEAILTAGDGVGVGRVFHYVNGKFDYHQRVYKFSNFKKHDGKFLYYYIKSKMPMQLKAESAKVTIDSIRLPMIQKFLLPIPLFKEQTAIANFLDEKTGTIDSAVEELENQRRLLKELKQATIHKAVTKGLDDNVPMKDSGVEWIGEIPVSKSLKKIKSILKAFEKSKIQVSESDTVGKFPFFTSSKKLSKKIDYPLLKNKEVVIMGTGGFANVHYYKGDLSYSTDCWCITSTENVKFLYYYLTSIKEAINTLGFNGMGLKHLQKEFINSNYIVSFDNEEQEKIVKYLDKKILKIDNSLEEIESKINYLKEYKKTLINDAVTGKIKVYKGDV